MSAHPITGRATVNVKGQQRMLAFDMNCAAALFESKGENWNDWLGARFLGEAVEGQNARRVTPLTPQDTISALYALLASDREDTGVQETEATLRRELSPSDLPDLQIACLQAVMKGFGLPGEFIESVVAAANTPRKKAAAGTGTRRSA